MGAGQFVTEIDVEIRAGETEHREIELPRME